MFARIAIALLFRKNQYWLMPLFVVMFSSFLLFEQFSAFHSVKREVDNFCGEGDLWVAGEKLGVDELLKVRRLNDVKSVSFVEDCRGEKRMAIKALLRTNLPALKGKVTKVTGRKVFTKEEFSKELFQSNMKENRAIFLFAGAVISGLILAFGIFVATFYYFFKRELVHYSVLKSVGVSPIFLTALLVFQGVCISLMGWSGAFLLYLILQQVSGFFFAISWTILGTTLGLLILVSVGTGLFVSFKVKGVE